MPTVDINGHEVEYDQEATESWDVADLLVTIDDAAPISQYEKLANMFQIVEMCTGLDKPHFIELAAVAASSATRWRSTSARPSPSSSQKTNDARRRAL